jgi:hypothetical protein
MEVRINKEWEMKGNKILRWKKDMIIKKIKRNWIRENMFCMESMKKVKKEKVVKKW